MENLNQAKTKENIETPDFLFENFEIETQEMINKRNHQEIIRYLNKILLLSKTSNYSNGLVHKAAQLIDKIFKNCLPDLEDPNRNLVLLQNVKLVLSQHPGVLVPQRCSLLSNLACTYRRLGKPHSAKKYLEKALEMMKNNREVLIDKASIYLNFCAVFSNLKRHKDALDYGTLAVQYAQDDMLNLCNDLPESEQIQKITVLAISYYNLAVEQEYLNRNDDACEWYNKALKFLQKHQETQNLIEISNSCKENLNSLKERGVKPLQRPQSSYENSKLRPVSAKSTVSSASKKAFDREKIYKPPLKKPKAFPVKIPQSANIFETRFPLEKKPGTFEQLKSQLEYETKFKMPNITDKTLKKNEIFSSEKRFMNVLSSEESKRNISIDENKRIVKTRPKSTRSHHRLMKSPYRLSSKHQPNIDNILVKLKVVKPTSPKKNDIEKILVIESQRDVTERINKPIKHSYPFLKDQDLSSICVDDSLDMTDMSLHFRSPTPKLDHEKQLKQAATKIQSIFRGNRDRAKTALRRKNSVKSEILYKSGKKINGIYYMITIYKVLGQYKLILANIADPDQRFEFEINNEGAQNPDDIIRSISHKDSRPYLDQTPINSLNHVQRIAKNISGKNIVLDCFASKHGENLLIKAKDIKSEQEYSLKLQNQYPFSPSKVVNEFKNRIIPHLLITNQSLEFINKDLKENLIQEFKLILAKSIYLNQEKSQISIMKSALCIKITVIGESLNEDLILTLDEIKNRLNILDEDLETIIEKLVNSIENNNALKFLTTNAVEVNSLSETKDETEFIGFVFEDNPQATHLLPETPNKAPKSI